MTSPFSIIYRIITIFKFTPHFILYKISDNKDVIRDDLYSFRRHTKCEFGEFKSFIILLNSNPYYLKLFYLRIGKKSKLVSWYASTPSTFYPISNIGGGVYLAHPYATILNARSIGKNFSCRQCTTIGNKIDGRNDLVPTIGDNVTLGANVVVIGDVRIGNNVTIGAGSVVVKDCPDNVIIAGNPARIIRKV